MKVIKWLFICMILAGIGSYLYVASKHPQRDGELVLAGLSAPVQVIYDEQGIPHIKAANDKDMYLAFGYIHAQDRLFQMDLLRRLGAGRLAEWFGKDALKMDRLFRTIQVGHYTSQWVEKYRETAPDAIVAAMDAYLSGINQFIDKGPTPIEYSLIGAEKEHFTPDDMAAVLGFTAFSFTYGITQDVMLTSLAQKLGADYIEDMGVRWQPGSTLNPVSPQAAELTTAYMAEVIEQLNPIGLFQGSNGWVVGPSKTRNGRPMLMNDPHMGFAQPSVWYEAHLQSPESEIYGHHLALVPFAFLGHNRDIAWGLTMFMNDDIDLYREQLNPEDSDQYQTEQGWQAFESRIETIKIRGGEPVSLKVRTSRHGPVISDAYTDFDGAENPFAETDQVLSMWWLFYHPDNDLLSPLYEMTRAKSPKQMAQAAQKIYSPGLNVMFADRYNNIAWWAVGKLIKRPEHVNPALILDGASGLDEPSGYYDFSHNPSILNPERGYLLTANNQPADTGIGLIPGYYVARDRAKRIDQLLASKDDWDVESMKNMLNDSVSTSVPLVQERAISLINSDGLESESGQWLKAVSSWDAKHDVQAIEPTIYYHFKKQLLTEIFADEMGKHNFELFLTGFLRQKTLWKILNSPESPWWDNISTAANESMADTVNLAWNKTAEKLSSLHPKGIEQMAWGKNMRMLHRHPFGISESMAKIFNVGPFEAAGGNETINNMIFKLNHEPFVALHGPSTRRIVDFSDLGNSWGINPTGQSGVVTDSHFSDQAEMYVKGQFRPQIFLAEQLKAHKNSELEIIPENTRK